MKFLRAVFAVAVALIGATSVHAQAVSGQGTWETTLLGRDINLHEVAATDAGAVYLYDTTLNVTWLRSNIIYTWDWQSAKTSIEYLVTGSGANAISDWRLPKMTVDPNVHYPNSYNGSTPMGYNVPGDSSELASLFYRTLGNKAAVDTNGNVQAGYGLTNTASFQNLQYSLSYWFNDQNVANTGYVWYFNSATGYQGVYGTQEPIYAMAVRDGDVAPVPEPETYAMLLAGLGLIGLVSRRRTTKPIV